MTKHLYRWLPIVVGAVIGFLLVSPPELPSIPPAMGYTLVAAALLAAFLGFLMLVISGSLPAHVELEPVDESRLNARMEDLREEYAAVGFEQAGPPLEVGTSPPALLVPLVRHDGAAYGAVYRTKTSPPKTGCDIVSYFDDDESGLTTGNMLEGGCMPQPPQSFMQLFPQSSVEELWNEHVRALEFLRDRNLDLRRLTAEELPHDFREALARQRRHFFSRPFRNLLTILWRSTIHRNPCVGPLEEQSRIHEQLRQLEEMNALEIVDEA